jgi:hypothetical protein
MNGYANSIAGLLAVVAAGVVASIDEISDKPPALIALAIALVPGLAVLGRELGGFFDSLGARPRLRNLAGEELSWRDLGGMGGTLLGATIFVVLLVIALF